MPASCKASVIITAVLLLNFTLSHSQSARDHQEEADRYFLKKDYKKALKSYQEALAGESDNALAYFRAGISSLKEEDFSQAVGYLEKAYQLKADVDEALPYHLGMAYQKNHQFGKAREQFETLRSQNKRLAPVANRKIHECILGDSLMKIVVKAEVKLLPGEINTPFSESGPILSPDGTLMFTSNRTADDYQIKTGTNSGDVYTAKKVGNSWASVQKIGDHINVKLDESATSISSDGKTLFLYYEDGAGDIYTSSFENGIWSRPVALNKFVNHPQYRESSACVSADGKKLYFSSNRPGGKGGFDIYVSAMGANGQWGRPSNLGPAINTKGDETSPFISGDGGALYFSSDGHASLGDQDIFRSKIQGGKFQRAENLGYPINTSGYEAYFVLNHDNSTGYFSSRRAAPAGNTDIYEVDFSTSSHNGEENVLRKGRASDQPEDRD